MTGVSQGLDAGLGVSRVERRERGDAIGRALLRNARAICLELPLVVEARAFGKERHAGRTYGKGRPYWVHTDQVVEVLFESSKFPTPARVAAASLHDTLEDTETTLAELLVRFGPEVAMLVYAVTNEDGKNRAERHAKTYPKVRAVGWSAFELKCADRIANVRASYADGRDDLLKMYKKEWPEFREAFAPWFNAPLSSLAPTLITLMDAISADLGGVRADGQSAVTKEPNATAKLTPRQKEIVRALRNGSRIIRGQTAQSSTVGGYESFSWGEMLCRPTFERGPVLDFKLLKRMTDAGLLEDIEAPPGPKAESMSDFIRQQNTPRETRRLTAKGKTVDL